MPMAAIDYDDKMAIVAVIGKEEPEGREKIVAIGNYANNPNTRYAEVAFTTHQDWQDRGIGTFLLQYLIRIAKEKNIEGFTADVLSRNRAMMQVFSKCGCPMTTHLDTGVYELKINFGAEEKKE
jgi:RimJ/RimL family protein N-acetyltransferase